MYRTQSYGFGGEPLRLSADTGSRWRLKSGDDASLQYTGHGIVEARFAGVF